MTAICGFHITESWMTDNHALVFPLMRPRPWRVTALSGFISLLSARSLLSFLCQLTSSGGVSPSSLQLYKPRWNLSEYLLHESSFWPPWMLIDNLRLAGGWDKTNTSNWEEDTKIQWHHWQDRERQRWICFLIKLRRNIHHNQTNQCVSTNYSGCFNLEDLSDLRREHTIWPKVCGHILFLIGFAFIVWPLPSSWGTSYWCHHTIWKECDSNTSIRTWISEFAVKNNNNNMKFPKWKTSCTKCHSACHAGVKNIDICINLFT